MKLIIDSKNNIICRTNLINNIDIVDAIQEDIYNMYNKDSLWINSSMREILEDIEVGTGFDISLSPVDKNEISISADNGLVIFDIIELESIKEL